MSDPQRVVDGYFDRTAGYWLEVYERRGLEGRIYRERLAAALRWAAELGLEVGAPALDVGSGAGGAARVLAHAGLEVTATDSSPAMVELAGVASERAAPDKRFRVLEADAERLPFADESFELVTALGLLPWLRDPGAAVREMARVLRPGGSMIVTADNSRRLNRLFEPRENPLFARLKPAWHAIKRVRGPAPTGVRSYLHSPGEVDGLLAAAGLTPDRRTTIGYGPFTALGQPLLPDGAGGRVHDRLAALSAERLPALRGMGWHYLAAARK